MIETTAITMVPRGSWKWQNAYAFARYEARLTRDNRWVWSLVSRGPKQSEPQLRHLGITAERGFGGLHNRPLSPAEAAFATFAEAGLV